VVQQELYLESLALLGKDWQQLQWTRNISKKEEKRWDGSLKILETAWPEEERAS
jgi:hypothetical protein